MTLERIASRQWAGVSAYESILSRLGNTHRSLPKCTSLAQCIMLLARMQRKYEYRRKLPHYQPDFKVERHPCVGICRATGGTPVLHHLDRIAGFLSHHYCLRACSCKITQHIQRPGGHAAVFGKTSLRTFAAFLPGSKEVIGPRHSLPPAANEGEPWADGLHGCRTNA